MIAVMIVIKEHMSKIFKKNAYMYLRIKSEFFI